MAKAKDALRYAMTLASAIVIILVSRVADAIPSLRELARTYREVKEGAKDTYTGVQEAKTFSHHTKQFFAEAGLHDLYGRSFEATLCMALMLWGLTWLLLRKWKEQSWVSLALLKAYGLSVVYGALFEFLATWKRSGTGEIALGFLGFAGIVFLAGLGFQWKLFRNFGRAFKLSQLWRYVVHRAVLPPRAPATAPNAPTAPARAPAPTAPATPGTAAGTAPQPPAAPPPAAPPAAPAPVAPATPQPLCPRCGKMVERGGRYCGFCQLDLTEPVPPPAPVATPARPAPAQPPKRNGVVRALRPQDVLKKR